MLYEANVLFVELQHIRLLNLRKSSLIFNINQQKTALKRIKKLPRPANLPLETYEEEILDRFTKQHKSDIMLESDIRSSPNTVKAAERAYGRSFKVDRKS
jgi:hypothetical protein